MGETQIEFSLFWRFTPAEYEEVSAPADMPYQWRCSFVLCSLSCQPSSREFPTMARYLDRLQESVE
jgi:hypothetical protein